MLSFHRYAAAALLALGLQPSAQAHDTWFELRPAPQPGELRLALGTGNRFPVMEFPLGIEQLRLSGCRGETATPSPLAHDGDEAQALRAGRPVAGAAHSAAGRRPRPSTSS